MKKLFILLLLTAPFVLQFCSSSKKTAMKTEPTKITYTANVKPLIQANCTPCHFPPNGRAHAYDNYTAVNTDIDKIIDRVNRNPTDRGFMPMRHPKLSDSAINVLVQWKKDGLLEN
jgi:hypothetical protein